MQLAGPKPAQAMQMVLWLPPDPKATATFFQAVCHCLLPSATVPLGLGSNGSPPPIAWPLTQPPETVKVRGKPGTGDRKMGAGGRVICGDDGRAKPSTSPGA